VVKQAIAARHARQLKADGVSVWVVQEIGG